MSDAMTRRERWIVLPGLSLLYRRSSVKRLWQLRVEVALWWLAGERDFAACLWRGYPR